MRKRLRSERGFTLIEMMVVLAIIALIAVFAIPSITNALQNSRIKSVEAQARQIQNAFDSYYNDNNTYPNVPAEETVSGKATDADYDRFADDGTTASDGAGSEDVQRTEAYAYFFDDGVASTPLDSVSGYPAAGWTTANSGATAIPEGILTQYVSLATYIDDALFIPVAYAVKKGSTDTTPDYELVLEVKNVSAASRFIHITRDSIVRDQYDHLVSGSYDPATDNASHTTGVVTGRTAAWPDATDITP